MFSRLAYYGFVYPVSYLPLPIMYFIIDIFYLLLISIIPYRRKVVRKNIENSLPHLSPKERKRIERKFYRHLATLLAEGTKNLTISKKELLRRMKVRNPELLEDLHKQGKSVLLVSGHYNNWEWLITAQNLLFSHQAVGIGMPLTNKFWDKQLNARRSRFGMKIIHSKNLKDFFKANNQCIATLVLGDQSPGDATKAYWMEFLNQTTPVLFGTEMLAHQYNHAVVYFNIHRIKRGYYEIELRPITNDPSKMEWGEITEAHTQELESDILKNPEYWIWSHKRWKRTIPEDLTSLRKEQLIRFNQRYK